MPWLFSSQLNLSQLNTCNILNRNKAALAAQARASLFPPSSPHWCINGALQGPPFQRQDSGSFQTFSPPSSKHTAPVRATTELSLHGGAGTDVFPPGICWSSSEMFIAFLLLLSASSTSISVTNSRLPGSPSRKKPQNPFQRPNCP